MEIKDHKLVGDGVNFKQTPKVSGKFSSGLPDTIIIHYTAGHKTDVAVRVLTKPNIRASAHMVVGMDGEIVQLADLNEITWHAGKSAYDLPTGYRTSFNKYSIGIEISNPGYMKKVGDKYKPWYDGYLVGEDMIVKKKHRNKVTRATLWHKYPEVQVEKVFEICKAICEKYPIKFILGHEEVSPGRKTDPGPAFPLEKLREETGVWIPGTEMKIEEEPMPDGTRGTVTTILNFRTAPSGNADKIAKALEKGTRVEIISKHEKWLKVVAGVSGWVSKSYINTDNTDAFHDGVVTADSLNIRKGPSPSADKVAKPLPEGTKVDIIDQDDAGWYLVTADITGWVHGSYVDID